MLTHVYTELENNRTAAIVHIPFAAVLIFLYMNPMFIIYWTANISRLPARRADNA